MTRTVSTIQKLKNGDRVVIADRLYVALMHTRHTRLGYTVKRLQLFNPVRQFKKSFGLSGRQWTKYRKEAKRGARILSQNVPQS